jgi:multicomponent Na+:H+ antiporter subunit B
MEFGIADIVNVALLSLLVITAVAIVAVRNLLTATILLTIYSLLMAGVYLILGAPDVAITEAAIGAGISTVLFLAAILLTGTEERAHYRPLFPFIVVVLTGGALVYGTIGLAALGDPHAITNEYLIPYYWNESFKDIGIPNIVTSVLASYRGFDTLGETFVVFTAAVSVLLLLGTNKDESSDEEK